MASFYSLSVYLLLATTLLADPGSKNDRLVFTQNKIKADAGDANSQIYIGIAYGMGMGVPQDDVESTKWFLKAALQGNEMAIGLMGNTYETGKGVPIDKVEALKWYIKASGCNPSFPETRVFTEKVATWYRDGIGTEKDYQKARAWFNKAAELGSASAYCQIGYMIRNGDGVLADPAAALIYFERSAGMGDREAIYQLGIAYQIGSGVEINLQKSANYYAKSADLGYAPAQYNLALMHRDGTGVSKNLTLAYGLFTKASLQSAWPAQMELGVMLANGDGCERDLVEGLAWLVVASDASDLAATSRDKLIKVLSPYDVTAARRRAVELKTKLELIRANPSK
jgi:TPR repeat protein